MKRHGGTSLHAVFLVLAMVMVVGFLSTSAFAQTRPALVRDVDTPALKPFRAATSLSVDQYLNEQVLVTTVPAGQRLVIETISWSAGVMGDGQLIFGGLRSGQFGPVYCYLPINPRHASAGGNGVYLQDGSVSVKLYFEAGEQVWFTASRQNNVSVYVDVAVQGYFVTP
jgi:hypothetical protein